jgi:hypothetical protein
MPTVPTGKTNAPTIIVAGKGASIVIEDAKAARACITKVHHERNGGQTCGLNPFIAGSTISWAAVQELRPGYHGETLRTPGTWQGAVESHCRLTSAASK